MQAIRGAEIAMIFQESRTSLDPVYTVGSQLLEAIQFHQALSREQAKLGRSRCCAASGCLMPS